MTARWGHVLLLATPITESVPAICMWFHNVYGRKSKVHLQARKRLVLYELARTLTPAAWQVLTIFTYWARVLRLDVREHETGSYSADHSGHMDVLLCRAH